MSEVARCCPGACCGMGGWCRVEGLGLGAAWVDRAVERWVAGGCGGGRLWAAVMGPGACGRGPRQGLRR